MTRRATFHPQVSVPPQLAPSRPQGVNRLYRRISRRAWLGGAACGLALPLLDSLGARAQQAWYPKRLVLLYTANGTYPPQWFPSAVRSETDFDLNLIHQALLPYQDRMVLLRGVHNEVARDPDNNGGPHQRGIGGLFTGELLQNGEFVDGCGSTAGWANGISVDQRVAQLIGTQTVLASLELGVRTFDDDVQGRLSYAAAGAPLPPINDPQATWTRLFSRTPLAVDGDPASRTRAVMDAVHAQYGSLRQKVGRADQEKLDAHLSLVVDLERRLGLLSADGAPMCALTPDAPPQRDPDAEDQMPAISRTQLDLLAAAFACDLTRVASIQYSTAFNRIRYPWLNSLEEGHSLSHSGDSDTAAWNTLGQRQAWHAGELRYFLDRLASIPEGEGSVLDNTLVIWGTEVSQGNSHSLDNIPFLLVGGRSVGLRGGQFLDLDGRSHGDLLLAIVRMFGGDDVHFGHPDHGTEALEQILA